LKSACLSGQVLFCLFDEPRRDSLDKVSAAFYVEYVLVSLEEHHVQYSVAATVFSAAFSIALSGV